MEVVIPFVSYRHVESDSVHKDMVGVFSGKDKAKDAVANFVEGFLEQERAPYEIEEIDYLSHEVDKDLV